MTQYYSMFLLKSHWFYIDEQKRKKKEKENNNSKSEFVFLISISLISLHASPVKIQEREILDT